MAGCTVQGVPTLIQAWGHSSPWACSQPHPGAIPQVPSHPCAQPWPHPHSHSHLLLESSRLLSESGLGEILNDIPN